MTKKMPLTFWMLNSKVVMTYFMFVLLGPAEMAGKNFKGKKVIPLIFTQF